LNIERRQNMNNDLPKNKKRFSKEGAIIGGAAGAVSGFLASWLKDEFGLDFLTRLLIAITVSIIVGGVLYVFIRNK